MKRAIHIIGSVTGVGLTVVPVVTDALPAGAAKNTMAIVGAAILLLANVFKAMGRPA